MDTELEVIKPPTVRVEVEAAGRLRLTTDQVVTITFRRFDEGQPHCLTTAYLPMPLGKGLFDVPELISVRVR